MELSTPTGSSLAAPAAVALARPNPKVGNTLSRMRCLSEAGASSACLINRKDCSSLQAASPVQRTENLTQSSISFKDFCVSLCTEEDGLIKIQVNVSGVMTYSIFEKVFTKKVGAAQLPGFRRTNGGKTPDIPKEVALHLIDPSKVKKETIKKIINCTIAEYVQKEGLTASKNLKVEQSYEQLEAAFELRKEFSFDPRFNYNKLMQQG